MPKYSQYSASAEYESKRRRRTLHPAWRGVGFILMIVIPIVAYFLSVWLLEQNAANNWMAVPAEFLSKSADPLVFVKVGMTLVMSLLVYGIMMLFGFAGLRVFGPPRYGDLDSPPIKGSGGPKRWE